MSKVKLKDIAETAGVSTMTVSRVMNKDPKVGDRTRQRIEKIAKEMGYQPNLAARNLVSSRSFVLAVMCDHVNSSYANQFLLGCLNECRGSGYHIVIDETLRDSDKSIEIAKELVNGMQAEGIILLPPVCDDKKLTMALLEMNVPFIRISPNDQSNISPVICMDDYRAAYQMTCHLIEQGHTQIAHICGRISQRVSEFRLQGFKDALFDNQISLPEAYIQYGDFSYKTGNELAQILLNLPQAPTAIFAANDDMAAGALAAAQMHGSKVPEQVAIAGFDNVELARVVWPNLTTIEQPVTKMAELAVQLLTTRKQDAKNANEQTSRPKLHILKHALVNRAST
ncbi:LacI family DNA-binding transcriptional regulator [Glaciecola sp. KUL10]|uniref:LacI family DNA-binding transcriptional regulator n=1 Tax=Glaciecola sp. (strain KUL10) TaxID=2161813 RepID=UPI000D788B3F|nr:LacI family DNA-binding transcriptional regulator [Glaciecola sp. KUL10]GBL03713.1 glucose-resistance amylase regulator [Glaciecola sp. KUL10]